ncbi:head decoration protein [Acidocella sp.]|uniref:head decoration protein n=1 Tax=Acidocella sp. TaxID=50710 RepID=UPI00262159F4|nr:head decoration protein [Acidocella sp.]
MTLITSTVGDNPQQPAVYSEIYNPDQLIAGNLKVVSQPIILSGSVALPRGSVLGRASSYSDIVTIGATNVGNGTIGSITLGTAVLVGTYTLTAKSATDWSVTDPEGTVLADATTGTAYSQEGLGFTITAGGTAFSAADSFDVQVVNAIGTLKLSVKTASDGSQNPVAILADYADPSAGNVPAGAYFMGEFNINAVSYDSSWTPELIATAIPNGLFLKGAVTAADPGTATPAVI